MEASTSAIYKIHFSKGKASDKSLVILREEKAQFNILPRDVIYHGDCTQILKTFPDSSIDFIITSPPYADNRKKTYEGVPINKYVEWFLPIAAQLKRVLKPDGSFILNIKERAVNGQRQTYVLELILGMKEQGWKWVEEYMWHKKNCYPGKWPNRFRDAWERCLHFTKQTHFKMYQERVMVPMGNWTNKRLQNLSETDRIRDESKVGSGFGKNVSNWLKRTHAYPTNVLHLATESGNTGHSAAFPLALPTWFITLFTNEGDVVLDPFLGSGTSAIAAINVNRHYVGIEMMAKYFDLANESIANREELRTQSRKGHNGRAGTGVPDIQMPLGIPYQENRGGSKVNPNSSLDA